MYLLWYYSVYYNKCISIVFISFKSKICLSATLWVSKKRGYVCSIFRCAGTHERTEFSELWVDVCKNQRRVCSSKDEFTLIKLSFPTVILAYIDFPWFSVTRDVFISFVFINFFIIMYLLLLLYIFYVLSVFFFFFFGLLS